MTNHADQITSSDAARESLAHARRLELMLRCLNIPLKEDVAALEAGAAALRVPSQTWQPIETAPKDGSTIIGYDGSTGSDRNDNVEFFRWDGQVWRDPSTHSGRPTHWMPLPSPPRPVVPQEKEAQERS